MIQTFTEPYEWFYITEAFDNYSELLENLPEDKFYKQYNHYPKRCLYDCKDSFWSKFSQELLEKHKASRVQLCRDFPGYAIGPHTDGKERSTILYYLAGNDSKQHLGTSIYVPKNPNFTCDGAKHHAFKRFNKFKTVPYLPNTGFGFIRCDYSFHGVEKTDSVRNVIQVSIND